MSNDLPRVTTVHKSLGWARDFFSTSPVLVNRGKKNSSWAGDFSFYLEGQKGQRSKGVYSKDDSAQPGGPRAQGQVAWLKVAVLLSVTQGAIFAAHQDFFSHRFHH